MACLVRQWTILRVRFIVLSCAWRCLLEDYFIGRYFILSLTSFSVSAKLKFTRNLAYFRLLCVGSLYRKWYFLRKMKSVKFPVVVLRTDSWKSYNCVCLFSHEGNTSSSNGCVLILRSEYKMQARRFSMSDLSGRPSRFVFVIRRGVSVFSGSRTGK